MVEVASFRHVLKNRNFVLLWLAQLISLSILQAANFGIIVIINDITRSALMVGLAIIAFTLPAVPLGAIAGVVVDYANKRTVLWLSNLLRAFIMLLVVISLLSNRYTLWPLYALTFITSSIGQFFVPAESAAIPLLVSEQDLVPALSLFNITVTLSQVIGFLLLGGLIVKLFPTFALHLWNLALNFESIDLLFVIATVLYIICAFLIFCISPLAFGKAYIDKIKKSTKVHGIYSTMWKDVVDSWHIVYSDRLLFFAAIQLSVIGILLLLIGELAGSFVQQVLQRPSVDISIIFAPAAVGLVVASIGMPYLVKHVEKLLLTMFGFILLSLGYFLLPFSTWFARRFDPLHGMRSLLLVWITIAITFFLGVAISCVNIPTQIIMQEHASEEARGRVFALQFMMYNTGSIPVLLFAGVFTRILGLEQLMVLGSISILLFCLWGVWFVKKNEDFP